MLDGRSADADRKILRARVQVPANRLERGPRGARLQAVDFDASTRRPRKGLELAPRERPAPGLGFTDRFKTATDPT